MPRYRDDSRERVREAVDMLDLVSGRTDLRRAGSSQYVGLCPFHEERTPSFSVEPVKKVFYCHGCGAGGDVFNFVMDTEGLDFTGALETLADRYGVELEVEREDPAAAERRRRRERLYELLARAAAYYERCLWEGREAAGARDYLAGRGLGEQTLRAFGVGYAPSAHSTLLDAARRAGFEAREIYDAGLAQRGRQGPLYDRFRARITFPLRDLRGRVLGFGARALEGGRGPKYLNSPESELYHKRRALFGADRARAVAAKAGVVIVVEGYTDVLALHQAGIENAVGLMGTAVSEEQIAELARLAPSVVLALDADASGQEAMVRAAQVAAGRRLDLRVAPLPDGEDPADLVAARGARAFSELAEGAVPFVSFHVERVLAGADLGRAEGRDRALAQLREVLAAVPQSALREELVRTVASRLALSEQIVASLAAAGGGGGGGGREAPRADAPGAVLEGRERTERAFLALCIALPGPGRRALEAVDVDAHFTSELTRRAAAHLRERLTAPAEGLAEGDRELATLIAELSLHAASEPASPETLEVERLQLELARLERAIATARTEGKLEVSSLAAQRSRVKQEFDSAVDRASEG